MAPSGHDRRGECRASAAGSISALVVVLFMGAAVRGGEPLAQRPDLELAKPQATCGLQTLGSAARPAAMSGVQTLNQYQTAPEDPLASYARTPLGDWQMPIEVDRADPWLRFVVFAMKRPVVIDVAVFVDGRPYANGREAWIDDVLSESEKAAPAASASEVAKPAAPVAATDGKKVIVPEATSEPAKVSAQARGAEHARAAALLRGDAWAAGRPAGDSLADCRVGRRSAGRGARFEPVVAAGQRRALVGVFGSRSQRCARSGGDRRRGNSVGTSRCRPERRRRRAGIAPQGGPAASVAVCDRPSAGGTDRRRHGP